MTAKSYEALDRELDAFIEGQRLRDAEIAAFSVAHNGETFGARPKRSTCLSRIIVSPSLDTRGGWRLTRFDELGPCGHTEFETYEKAVREACVEYGVDFDVVEFPG